MLRAWSRTGQVIDVQPVRWQDRDGDHFGGGTRSEMPAAIAMRPLRKAPRGRAKSMLLEVSKPLSVETCASAFFRREGSEYKAHLLSYRSFPQMTIPSLSIDLDNLLPRHLRPSLPASPLPLSSLHDTQQTLPCTRSALPLPSPLPPRDLPPSQLSRPYPHRPSRGQGLPRLADIPSQVRLAKRVSHSWA